MRIQLTLEYNGKNYCGWQRQQNGVSVQQKVEEALFALCQTPITITGASRTDAGVHALCQVAHFDATASIPPEKYAWALNTKLPRDIRCVQSCLAAEDFHARFMAKSKIYCYTVCNRPHASALYNSYHFYHPLDVEAMQSAAACLVGTHDFAAFRAAGSDGKTTVRTIYSAKISRENDFVTITVHGNGFLYNMVRIIAGTLCYIGCGMLPTNAMQRMLETKNRTLGGPTAPPEGLTLQKIYY